MAPAALTAGWIEYPPTRPLIKYKGLTPLIIPLWGLRPFAPCRRADGGGLTAGPRNGACVQE